MFVVELNIPKVKWPGLPIKIIDQVKSQENACNVKIEICGRSILIHAVIIDDINFVENYLLGNNYLDALKIIFDNRSQRLYFQDKGPRKKCWAKFLKTQTLQRNR